VATNIPPSSSTFPLEPSSTSISASPSEAPDVERLAWAGYSPSSTYYDEVVDAQNNTRVAWQALGRIWNRSSDGELARRREQTQRLLHENGVAYNAFSDFDEEATRGDLDIFPLVISAAEWHTVSEGLQQRAKALNALLADLHGPQNLISRGLLPPEVLYANPSFWRSFHGMPVAGGIHLHFYAADLARAADGSWRVLADRTESPSGAGYALENRIVLSRVLPHVYHECHVQRLAGYFMTVREHLASLAPRPRDNPRVVLLSRGPRFPSYFEDAYLARYLGYTLVEGGDLTVRNDAVFLKTLAGLLPVDVIWRRVDDADCDPLELRRESALGVAGLLEACRAGNVAIVNMPGTGLVESLAVAAELPKLAPYLINEQLKLASVPTWWCRNSSDRETVLSNLDQLIIKPAFLPRSARAARNWADLTRSQRESLLRTEPLHYAARSAVERSTAPSYLTGEVQTGRVTVRAFLVAQQNGSYEVMPGALVRVSVGDNGHSGQAIVEGRKDAWVLSDRPVKLVSLLSPSNKRVELRRSGAELPSRVADNFYWLGRMAERAEGAARLWRAVLSRLADESDTKHLDELPILVHCLADQGQIEPGFVVEGLRDQLPSLEDSMPQTVFDEGQVGSLRFNVVQIHKVASIVRDRLSLDCWRLIHRVEREFRLPAKQRRGQVDVSDVLANLNQLIIDLTAFGGLVMENTTRHQGWRFLDLGRRLERATHTLSLIRNTVGLTTSDLSPVLEATLEVADSVMTYRSRYLNQLQVSPLLDLLLTDETNPRSVLFQVAAIVDHVSNLPRKRNTARRSMEERLALALQHYLQMADVHHLSKVDDQGNRTQLNHLLVQLTTQLPRLADVIAHKYLVHSSVPKQLVDFSWEGPR
jgi:uncharacterized circularly permuted ATP-grasp superfamily protein/uncharacterized alpha-E superfamily protein